MKIVSASRLTDGVVVHVGTDGGWVGRLADARRFEGPAAAAALEEALARRVEIAVAWLVEVGPDGAPIGRESLKEAMRDSGPSVRPDLGKQARGGVGQTIEGRRS